MAGSGHQGIAHITGDTCHHRTRRMVEWAAALATSALIGKANRMRHPWRCFSVWFAVWTICGVTAGATVVHILHTIYAGCACP